MNKDFHTLSPSESLNFLGVTQNGLKTSEAEERLKKYGENKLAPTKKKNPFVLFFSQFTDIMIIILLCASAISMTIAIINQSYNELVDGFIILGIVLLNAIISFWQEKKAEHSLEALKKLTQPEAKVVRNGEVYKILSKFLTIGDIIILDAGDIVPADCRLIESISLKCDESSLTGESVAVEKFANLILNNNTILAERKNMVYSGSVITNGKAIAVVVNIGNHTEIGKIANLISSSKKEDTPLQKGIKHLGKIITYIVLIVCAITFVVEVIANPTNPLEAFLTAVAIAVAAIPESLPAVITIIMSLGVAKLAKKKAIIKHLNAVETLGSCQIICSDKTGTLTQNKMQVQKLFFDMKTEKINNLSNSPTLNNLISTMMLCESVEHSEKKYIGDPTEIALVECAEKIIKEKRKDFLVKFEKKFEIPFDSNRKLMSVTYSSNNQTTMFTKGAVDKLIKLCSSILVNGKIVKLSPSHIEKILETNKEMSSDALRVLAFAFKNISNNNEQTENDLVFVGLAGMIDPPRKEVKKAVEKCKTAGILPIMITGDHKHTALAIAKEIGLANNLSEVITGTEIDRLNDENFEKIIFSKKVFARVSPENKVRIVETFKKLGNIVAMTGDGVNDAPSIKKANIGIGMGITGTDVTKEVADVIITDDNFATIIIAVEEGRKIYSNIQKTVQFLFTANLAEITAIFFATIFMPSLVFLTPVQILFVNLISDTLPAIALGLEPPEKDIMKRPPNKTNNNLLSNHIGSKIIIIGIIQGIIMLSCFLFGLWHYDNPLIATTMAFYSLNIVQFFYFLSMRTNDSIFSNPITNNKFAVLAFFSCFIFVVLVASTPLSSLLGLCALPILSWLFIGFACALTFILSEIVKSYKTY